MGLFLYQKFAPFLFYLKTYVKIFIKLAKHKAHALFKEGLAINLPEDI